MLRRKHWVFTLVRTLLFSFVPIITNVHSMSIQYTPNQVCQQNPPYSPPMEAITEFNTCKLQYKQGMSKLHPDRNKSTGKILSTYGYTYKVYKVTSKDGYILSLYRVTGSPNLSNKQNNKEKQAVLLMHGLSLASDCWFFQHGNKNLVFKLADANYEVWLANARGNSYSMEHTTLDAQKDIKYWDFSWHEMGVMDLPVMVSKILEVSGNEKIFFVGHSMGTTLYFAGASEVPALNKQIHASFLLTPQAYMGHMNNPGRTLLYLVDTHEKFQVINTMLGGHFKSMSDYKRMGLKTGENCDPTAVQCGACDNLMFSLFGYNAPHMNNSILTFLFSKWPNSYPVKALAHYAQSTMTCSFRHYDYGRIENIRRYNSILPPEYDLHKIKTPLYFFYSERDNYAPHNDVNITAGKLRPGVLKGRYLIDNNFFTHMDYTIAKDADVMVYNHILRVMKEYKYSK